MPTVQMRPSLWLSHDHSLGGLARLEPQLIGARLPNKETELVVGRSVLYPAHFGDHMLLQMPETHGSVKDLRQNLPASLRVSLHAAAWVAEKPGLQPQCGTSWMER